MAERKIRPDLILIGEPTSEARLGDIVKIGRRGSVNMWITIPGTQGHVAYPHRADNPVPKLAKVIDALEAIHLDDGSESFQPSNLEITAGRDEQQGDHASSPLRRAQLNIRFNNLHRGEDLARLVRTPPRQPRRRDGRSQDLGEAFRPGRGRSSPSSGAAIEAETGRSRACPPTAAPPTAASSSRVCPVVDFGLPSATMHKLDRSRRGGDIHALQRILHGGDQAALS
jgi:succinyl-diaminopimelate desuccinylase